MTIATKNRAGLMGPEHAKTLAKVVLTDSTDTISGAKTFTNDVTVTGRINVRRATATTASNYIALEPTDIGAGKPGLYLAKSTTANIWNVTLYDLVNNAGVIDFIVGVLRVNGVDIALVNGPIFTAPPRLPSYTVATLPSAATYIRGLVYVSDGTSNKRFAVSDGTNWRWPDGAIVS